MNSRPFGCSSPDCPAVEIIMRDLRRGEAWCLDHLTSKQRLNAIVAYLAEHGKLPASGLQPLNIVHREQTEEQLSAVVEADRDWFWGSW